MKLNVSNELKSRLMHAAENGSVIAKDILLEVKVSSINSIYPLVSDSRTL